MVLRAAEIDEDALEWSRDREGADVFTGVFNVADVFTSGCACVALSTTGLHSGEFITFVSRTVPNRRAVS